MLARNTLPAVGASVCAAGNQVWNGNMGTLIAKAMAKARNTQIWKWNPYPLNIASGMLKVPFARYKAMMATSRKTLPKRV
jgi:hypothetical protein